MADDRWQRVKQIFASALERAPEERSAFLAEACAGDATLRREVESLVSAHGQASGFLDSPVLEPPSSGWVGRRVGSYRIVGELGHGGMGTVFCAVRDDDAFSKEVALKLVRGGPRSEALVRRFHGERQILARLQHPAIATVLDGGTTEDGQPYLVMEYVEGEPIDRYCSERRLPLRARLEMFRQVCAAVHYAHQNLVVHRDIKPANILVAEDANPKLLDFGIAKLLDAGDSAEAATATILPALTPEYASPEQVRGEAVTTAADVYSLGVLLYELLTGQRPYALNNESMEQIVRAVCETEPPSPSTRAAASETAGLRSPGRASELKGDLDTIVMKALRKDPARRYGSVQELSEDVRRHLVGLPVLARPDTLSYRATKFVTRHKAGVSGAVLVALLTLGFGVVSLMQARRVRRERDKAERVSAFLVDLFRVADPTKARANSVTVREILDKGVERIRTELKEEPDVRSTLMNTMGVVYKNLALYETAEPLLREALATRERELGEHPDVAEAMQDLAVLLWHKGEYAEAESLLRRTVALRRKLNGEAHPKVARALTNLGNVLADKGDGAAAEALYREALSVQRRGGAPGDTELPKMINNLAIVLQERGAYAEAAPLQREGLAMQRALLGNQHPHVGRSMGNLATLLEAMGDYAGAEATYREALAITRKALGNEHTLVAATLDALGGLLAKRGEYVEAETMGREALALDRKLLGDRHPDLAQSLGGLAGSLLRKGDAAAAEPLLREGLAVARATLGVEHATTARLECQLGDTLRALGRLDEAEAAYRSALEVDRRLLGPSDRAAAGPLAGLGLLRLQKGDHVAAEPLLREALGIRRAALPAEHPETADAESLLGACLLAEGRFAEAEPLLLEGHRVLQSKTTGRSRESREARERLARLYQAWGRPEDARRYASLAPS